MAKFEFLVFAVIFSLFFSCNAAVDEARKDYIVYMGSLPQGQYSLAANHLNLLQEVVGESSAKDSLIQSYKYSFNGFAAKLTEQERQKLASMKDQVVSIFPNRALQLHTTKSWDFMGVNRTFHRVPTVESDIVIGVIDTGLWPESESFSDKGFGPIPAKWKGSCKGGKNFTCNKKVIGAYYYSSTSSFDSARDDIGHGSHTASTAAGNEVKGASFFGLAEGTARGGVPSARIAAYRVCGFPGCQGSDILAAFDQAIQDGVDIITISVGGLATSFYTDAVAIGAFHAMEKGILTIQSAGNDHVLGRGFISSVAPWTLSVTASSIDRRFITKVVLGSGKELAGISINRFTSSKEMLPLVYGKKGSTSCSEESARQCADSCLEKNLVKGKIVVCDKTIGIQEAIRVGASGLIVLNVSNDTHALILPLPAAYLGINESVILKSYLKESAGAPKAKILKTETTKDPAAPVVAKFASRGPNGLAPDILKPDISAPGVNILAAYSPVVSVSGLEEDNRSTNYNIISGTSMACPHVAGVAAYVKTIHPDWSPSAIKSALMTTAWPMDNTRDPDHEFAYGAGHVNPVEAANPGLIYEASQADYLKFLCDLGYKKIHLIAGASTSCPEGGGSKASTKDHNYPSFAAAVHPGEPFSFEFPRKVTNVGSAHSTYTAKVFSNSKVNITVKPCILSFKSINETKSFTVIASGDGLPEQGIVSSSLVWTDGAHSVRSPIVVYAS